MSNSVKRSSDVRTSETFIISDDGGWCWFESPGALQYGSLLLVGSVASGGHNKNRHGNIELHIHDCSTQITGHVTLHEQVELDDHDGPALLVRPDQGGKSYSDIPCHSQPFPAIRSHSLPFGAILSHSEPFECLRMRFFPLGSNGTKLCPLQVGLSSPDEGAQIFRGDLQHVAWINDPELCEQMINTLPAAIEQMKNRYIISYLGFQRLQFSGGLVAGLRYAA
jgi:hypothetical protein